jgi:hypothetical protein
MRVEKSPRPDKGAINTQIKEFEFKGHPSFKRLQDSGFQVLIF